jgi:transcriptional regulator with XRE-family HTH domain
MGSPRYKERKHDVGRRLLTLRTKTRLTQTGLATLIGVNRRSIQNWETGTTYPQESHLERLISVYLEQGGLTPGREREEAEALWEQVSQDAPRPLALFDVVWFDQLLVVRTTVPHNR